MCNMDEKNTRLVEVSRAYYLENRTQAEIAASLGITRSQVSRDLKEARQRGIVKISITLPDQESYSLEEAFLKRFPHLVRAIVTPSFSEDIEANRNLVGRYAANYLLEVARPGQKIVIGCGRTMRCLVDALRKTDLPGARVIQAMGNLGHPDHDIDYNEICTTAANAFGVPAYYLSAPAILGPRSGKARQLIQANPTIQAVLEQAQQADIYIFGVGSMESELPYVRVGMIAVDEMNEIARRAVGDICGRFFDLDGIEQPTPFGERIVGIDLADLRRASQSIGVATGPDKIEPLLGALNGGWINAVVTDEKTARQILAKGG
jgi:deoxyribonucleoside regulator